MAGSDTQALLLRVSLGMLVAGIIDNSLRSTPRRSISGSIIPTLILGILAGGWLGYVNLIAPKPYLVRLTSNLRRISLITSNRTKYFTSHRLRSIAMVNTMTGMIR